MGRLFYFMKNIKIVLDYAHGEEVAGKRSPDGKFREYSWSRKTLKKLKEKLITSEYEVFESNSTEKEIGLSNRANNTNKITGKKIFISLHSDAAGSGMEWMNARGYSVYTTKGVTNSDIMAEEFMKQFAIDFPELKARPDRSDGDLDKEENFTVIYKANCPAVLIEWLFQDNIEDVKILLNEEYNIRLVNSLFTVIEKLNNTL